MKLRLPPGDEQKLGGLTAGAADVPAVFLILYQTFRNLLRVCRRCKAAYRSRAGNEPRCPVPLGGISTCCTERLGLIQTPGKPCAGRHTHGGAFAVAHVGMRILAVQPPAELHAVSFVRVSQANADYRGLDIILKGRQIPVLLPAVAGRAFSLAPHSRSPYKARRSEAHGTAPQNRIPRPAW